MERIYKNKQISFFKDNLWSGTVAGRSTTMTPLYLERYRGARRDKNISAHNHWEFSAHISGSGVLIADTNLQIIPDMVILIPPGVEHCESAEQELDTIWLGFQWRHPEVAGDKILSLKSQEMINRLIQYWLFSVRNYGPIGPELDGILLTLTGYFFRKLANKRIQTPMQQAVEYFNEHFQEPVSMSDLAEQLNCSEGHFYRQFKEFTGETPIRFLNSIRLKKAAFYLHHSELPVNKIASLCGFSDPYYFSRIFRKDSGLSPSMYREVYHNNRSNMS